MIKKQIPYLISIVFLLTASSLQSATPQHYLPGQIIVKIKDGASLSDLQELNAQFEVTATAPMFPKTSTPEERLKKMKDERKNLDTPTHSSYYWHLKKDSEELKHYENRIEKEKQILDERITNQQALIQKLEARMARVPNGLKAPNLDNIVVLTTTADQDLDQMIESYKSNPNVEYAEKNYIVSTHAVPNDPLLESQYGFKAVQAAESWNMADCDQNCEGENIIVAVVDSGVNFTHQDLANNIFINALEIADNGIDDDSNGYIDDVRGWSFYDNSNRIWPGDNAHGTHCAGVIAAEANNGIGIAGVAPKAKILAANFLGGTTGNGTSSNAAKAIRYATDMGADVINNSWGQAQGSVITDAVKYAYANGAALIFAAGNANTNISSWSFYELPEIVTVAAIDKDGAKATFSNYGSSIDLAAPGVNILSTVFGNDYGNMSGTSMAAPHVSGVAALLMAKHPTWPIERIYNALMVGTANFNPSPDQLMGYGVANAFGSLQDDTRARLKLKNSKFHLPNDYIFPGDEFELEMTLQTMNLELGTSFETQISTSHPDFTLIRSVSTFNQIAATTLYANSESRFRLKYTGSQVYFHGTIPLLLESSAIQESLGVGVGNRIATLAGFPVRLQLGPSKTACALADMNNDGKLDIVALVSTSTAYSINVLKNDGTLMPGWPQILQVSTDFGRRNTAPVVADIDNDGSNEIILSVPNASTDTSKVYIWRSNGTFYSAWPRSSSGIRAATVAVADLENNGKMEIFCRMQNQVAGWTYSGSALSGWPISVSSDVDVTAPVLADLDNDGVKEIIAVNNKKVSIWRKDGSVFGSWNTDMNAGMNSPAVADLDRDGFLDVITTQSDGKRILAYTKDRLTVSGWPYALETPYDCKITPVIGDLNGDDKLEVVVLAETIDYSGVPFIKSKIFILSNTGALIRSWPAPYEDQFTGIALADMDNDKKPEIIVSGDSSIYVFTNAGETAYGLNGTVLAANERDLIYTPTIGDLNQDNRLEIVAQSSAWFETHDSGSGVSVWTLPTQADNTSAWTQYGHDASHSNWYESMPKTPTGFKATPISASEIRLSWDNQDNQQGFRPDRSLDGTIYGTMSQVAIGANATSYVDQNLSDDMSYYYRLRAYNGVNISEYSEVATAKTFRNGPPTAPTWERLTTFNDIVSLFWLDNSYNETGFEIVQSDNGTNYTPIRQLPAGSTQITDIMGLQEATKYFFKIKAKGLPTDSAYSSPITTMTRLMPPANMTVVKAIPTSLEMRWEDKSKKESNYVIERSTNYGVTYQVLQTLPANTTHFNISNPGAINHYYRLKCILGTQSSTYVGIKVVILNPLPTPSPTSTPQPSPTPSPSPST